MPVTANVSPVASALRRAMITLDMETFGRTFGLDIVLEEVRKSCPEATRDEVWEAACASPPEEDPEDEICYEDCADPCWGNMGTSC